MFWVIFMSWLAASICGATWAVRADRKERDVEDLRRKIDRKLDESRTRCLKGEVVVPKTFGTTALPSNARLSYSGIDPDISFIHKPITNKCHFCGHKITTERCPHCGGYAK